jgi:hypothetical protein
LNWNAFARNVKRRGKNKGDSQMKPIIAALLLYFSPVEAPIINKVAKEYHLTTEQTALLVAIRRAESGRPGCEFGIEVKRAMRYKGDFERSLELQCRWAAGGIKKRYTGDVDALSLRWCPKNHVVWARNVKYFMRKAGENK